MPTTNPAGRFLVLLRHAQAEPMGSESDEIRALTRRGRRQCGSVGAGLMAAGLLPELVVVSAAMRARQTWESVAAALGDAPAPEVVISDVMYQARVTDVVNLVRATDDRVRTLLVVGHEPVMSASAAFLAGSGGATDLQQVRTGLATASYAVLDVATGWGAIERDGCVLRDVVRPEW